MLMALEVMSFGLLTISPTFEPLMENLLRDLLYFMCLVYLDDIISIAKKFDDAVNNSRAIFSKLRQVNSKLNKRSASCSKSSFNIYVGLCPKKTKQQILKRFRLLLRGQYLPVRNKSLR